MEKQGSKVPKLKPLEQIARLLSTDESGAKRFCERVRKFPQAYFLSDADIVRWLTKYPQIAREPKKLGMFIETLPPQRLIETNWDSFPIARKRRRRNPKSSMPALKKRIARLQWLDTN
jgi:hypothetical protein